MRYAEIIIDINNKNVDRVFHYKIPQEMQEKISLGMRVFVPFGKGNRLREGYIVGFTDVIDIAESLIKPIYSLPEDYQIFSQNMIELAKFMADKYYSALSEALQCIMPKMINDKPKKYICINYENENIELEMEKVLAKDTAQSRVLKFLGSNTEDLTVNEIKKVLNISSSPIQTLEKNQVIKIYEKSYKKDVLNLEDYKKTHNLRLNEEQLRAFHFAKNSLYLEHKKPIVLKGVTGSGKTEVYLQLIDEVIKSGKQAIVLVPEISLTPQTVDRFVSRFGDKVSVTHSRLSDSERLHQWKKAREGEISIMVGARSAIFTPFQNLGVIIIDEEHESSYKSETTPKYDTREIAIELARLTNSLVVLGSATPSIETYFKAKTGKYELLHIENRVNNTPPIVDIVDMRKELEQGNSSIFSIPLFNAIKENLESNMQTILFLNRRGHSTFISCRECGYVLECENCNINYTYHLSQNKLICHYCGSTRGVPNLCPECSSKHIKYFGIGTQKIEDQIKKFFPRARVLRMDLDTTSKKNSHQNILDDFKNHNADILIGTQMIAKGLDFPKVSLVGVIAADLSLNTGEYKSSENCFQLLTQVVGRAGRADIQGRAFIQTYNPEHYSILLAKQGNYNEFYKREIIEREIGFYPPFSNIFSIVLSGENEEKIQNCIKYLHSIMMHYNVKTNFYITDFIKANVYKAKNQYRYKMLIKAEEETRLKNFVIYCVDILKREKDTQGVNIILNLNPNYIY